MSVLVCEGITKQKKNMPSVRNFTYNFLDNKIYAIVGKSDSGSDLLLKIISAREKADSGLIFLDGEILTNNKKINERLCYVDNGISFPGHMRITSLYKLMDGFYPKWDNGYAYELLRHFKIKPDGIYNSLDESQKELLNGIIGLASRANVTVLNNPLDGADIKNRFDFFNLLYDHHQRYPRTLIISTNHIDELESVVDKVLFLDNGILFENFSRQDIKNNFRYLSGKSEVLKSLISGIKIIGYEERERNLTVCVPRRLSKDETRRFQRYMVEISDVPIQKIFIYLINLRELRGI